MCLPAYRLLIFLFAGSLLLTAAGCQKTVYLMPTPAVLATGEHNPFNLNPNLEKSNRVDVLFATNRLPVWTADNRNYTIFPGNKLRIGLAHFIIGDKKFDWRQVFDLSTSDDQQQDRPALHLENLEEIAAVPLGEQSAPLSEACRSLFAKINNLLAKSIDKNITVYVHGANSTIYRAAAQAAQYRHFTGRNSLVLVFLWPSAENILAYGTDVRHAKKSAPAFKRLIELLARHTTAQKINILAYSAGAQIASPGLWLLGGTTEKNERHRLRLGEVYFAAADVGIDTFVEHLQAYFDIPRSVTLTVNMQDSVLSWAERHHGVSRAGRPQKKDLSEDALRWTRETSNSSKFDIIGVGGKTISDLPTGSHDFWYAHPWISSDVLVQFLFHADPKIRGLEENIAETGLRYWTFPADYPDRIIGILRKAKAETETER